MRYPFWRWTGWLSITLTGCLHGQDWRAVVTKPTSQTVPDHRESRQEPKVVGPIRNENPRLAPPAVATISSAMPTRPVPTNIVQFSKEKTQPKETPLPQAAKTEPRSRDNQVTPVGLELPPKVPPASAPVVAEIPRSRSFAEFERTITQYRDVTVGAQRPQADPVEKIVVAENAIFVEESIGDPSVSDNTTQLPVIVPAGTTLSLTPTATPPAKLKVAPASPSRGLFSKSAVPAKELPDVTATTITTAAAKESPGTDADPIVRPRDVSVLVEQVFEDLRLRRMNDARQRTALLKQRVLKRAPASSEILIEAGSTVDANRGQSVEPRRLDVDPQAMPVEESAPETFFEDEESTSCK